MRIPADRSFAPTVRAVVGAAADAASFNYDDIVHLRVATTESLDLAIGPERDGSRRGTSPVALTFTTTDRALEIAVTGDAARSGWADAPGLVESVAVVTASVDVARFETTADGRRQIRLSKWRLAPDDDR